MYNAWYKYYKDELAKGKNEQEQLTATYYFYRNFLYFQYLFYGDYYPAYQLIDGYQFVFAFAKSLKKMKIDYQVGLTIPNYYGELEDIIVKNQVVPVIKLKSEGEDIYVIGPDREDIFGEVNPMIQGSTVYFLDTEKAAPFMLTDTIPIMPPAYNSDQDSIFITLGDEGFLSLHNSVISKGNARSMMYDFFITPVELYMDEPINMTISGKITEAKLKDQLEQMQSLMASKGEYAKQRDEQFQDFLRSKYYDDKVLLDSLKVIDQGRWSVDKPQRYEYWVRISNATKRAGKYTIVDIGKLIGRNKVITDEEKDRTVDMFQEATQEVNWIINFEFPEDYKIKECEHLRMELVNSCGSFKSVPVLDGNVLTVNVTKTYFKAHYPVELWPEMLEFLEMAVNFTQQQVLLEKVSEGS